jgi:hypothetical protein
MVFALVSLITSLVSASPLEKMGGTRNEQKIWPGIGCVDAEVTSASWSRREMEV